VCANIAQKCSGNTIPRMEVKNWCFTEFDMKSYDSLQEILKDKCRYFIYQAEVCPTTGKEHIQGYIQALRSRKIGWLKKNISSKAHFEPAKGSVEDNIKYCSKEPRSRPVITWGTAKSQGQRTDLEIVAEMVKKKTPLKAIVEEHTKTFIKFHRGIERAISILVPQRDWPTKLIILIGPTGCGKTSAIYSEYKKEQIYDKDPDTVWFDGYVGQEVVLIDEFNGKIPYTTMLKLSDRYPMQVQTKGGHVNFCPRILIVTSNIHPDLWWIGNDCKSIVRRVTYYKNYYIDVEWKRE
jgi:hypothetical protein